MLCIDELEIGDYFRCIKGFGWIVDGDHSFVYDFSTFEGVLLDKNNEEFFFLENGGRVIKIFDYHDYPTMWIRFADKRSATFTIYPSQYHFAPRFLDETDLQKKT